MKHKYRADIDGLRSIAVLLVLFFHAGFSLFPGGFVGVDVFFVISGYLISTIIYREISEGTFTFRAFYKRRIQRLAPAMFVLFFTTTITAYIILLPSDFYSYAKSLIAAALSFSNIFFWRENGGYFGGEAELVPLLHTWSLAIEEQYYLIWPIYLILFFKVFPKRYLLPGTIILFLSSLFLSQWVANVTFGASYYLLPTRIFELAAGSILAIIWNKIPAANRSINNALSLCGLVLILASAFILSKSHLFPGFNAVYVILGTSILIYTGKENPGIINRLLSLKPFVFIGLLSYSLYLWHWPIIVFIKYTGVNINPTISWSIIITSTFAAWLSWKFVEQPFRYKSIHKFSTILTRLFLIPLFIACLASGYILVTMGAPSRFPDKIVLMDKALASKPEVTREGCHSPSRHSDVEPDKTCLLGAKDQQNISTFMIGDSHANHFTGFIDEIASSKDITVQDYTLDACLPVFDFYWGRNPHYANLCKMRNDISAAYIKQNHFTNIILAGEWPYNGSYKTVFVDGEPLKSEEALKEVFTKALHSTLQVITNNGATPILIKDNPSSSPNGPKCSVLREVFGADVVCETPRSQTEEHASFMNSVLKGAKQRFPELQIIDPLSIMCDDSQCYSDLDGIPLYRDVNHLNDFGSRALGEKHLKTKDLSVLPPAHSENTFN